MKILLISFENTLVAFGIRMISASLKAAGYSTEILFLPREFDDLESEKDIGEITSWIASRDPDLIGISLMSSQMKRVLQVQKHLKKTVHCPIIWGGIHPTLRPDECLAFTDMVCVGEGERAIVDLVKALEEKGSPDGVLNIYYTTDSTIVKNPLHEREDNLDDLPFADQEDTTHFIYFDGLIREMNVEIWRNYVPGLMDTHYVMSSRGCPHNCTYCCNSALRNVTCGPYLRRRSPEHFIEEMAQVKSRYPKLKAFVFMDDSFFYGTKEWFEVFCAEYKRKVNLPFFCWANPTAVSEDRIRPLTEAGLVGVHVGLESASRRISEEIYQRKVPLEQFYKCMDVLHDHRKKIVDIRVDVITDNPYETENDVAATIDAVSRLKKPFFIGIVSLIFYPQTELERKAIQDGIIQHGDSELFTREFFYYRPTFLNRLMRTAPLTPGFMIRFFLKHRTNSFVKYLFYLYYFGYFVAIRRQARSIRRIITLKMLDRFEHRIDPKKVVTTRVALIDF